MSREIRCAGSTNCEFAFTVHTIGATVRSKFVAGLIGFNKVGSAPRAGEVAELTVAVCRARC